MMTLRFLPRAVGVAAVALAAFATAGPVSAGGTMRAAIDASDIPSATGQASHGGTGFRWMGWTIFDSLVYFDQPETGLPKEIPHLAEEFGPRPDDQSKWVFKLRRGVKFHDGTDFNADAVIWNIEKLHNPKAPQYDEKQRGNTACCLWDIKAWKKIDDYTVEIDTGEPNAMVLYRLPWLWMASPTAWQKAGSWDEFAKKPVGTGPYKVEEIVPRERAVLVRNADYWDKPRTPKLDKLIVMPIPDPNTRASALLSGQVDFIENPPADTLKRLESAGMQVIKNKYPHIWPYFLRQTGRKTPLMDVRVRQAINLAVDREGIVKLLDGNGLAATGHVLPDSLWFGNPKFKLRYDPEEAKKLLAAAGYGPGNPAKFTMVISSGGSGQMQPLQMNEFIQQNLKAVGVQLDFKVVDWQTLRTIRNKGPLNPENDDVDGVNNSWGTGNPPSTFEILFAGWKIPPNGLNWGTQDAELDAVLKKAQVTFERAEQDKLLARAHEIVMDKAYMLWAAYDINVNAASPKVTGWKPKIAWEQDYTGFDMKN